MLRSSIKVFITFPARLLSGNIFWFERQFPALQFIFFGTITFRMLLGHVIVLERMLATIYAKDYEHYKKNTFTGVWFSVVVNIFWEIINSRVNKNSQGILLLQIFWLHQIFV
jgi:hypothetical protein